MKYTGMLKKKFSESDILIVAHQGFGGGNIVLNTPNAMSNAINHGAHIVELDVSRSKDGVFFIFHQDLEPRHLGIQEKIDQMTSEKIKELPFINNSCSVSKSHVSTLSEMMRFLKTQEILINVDKCDLNGSELLKELDKFEMDEQIIIKGPCDKDYLDLVAAHNRKYMFIPLVFNEKDVETALSRTDINTVGFEMIFSDLNQSHIGKEFLSDLKKSGYFLWVNAITLGKEFCLSADIDDDLSMLDHPDKGWGALIDMGFNVIQTDWTPMLKNYLMEKGLY